MTHYSKLNGKLYFISKSVDYLNGKDDDITLIWFFEPYDEPSHLVGWYYGGYDYNLTEYYIKREI